MKGDWQAGKPGVKTFGEADLDSPDYSFADQYFMSPQKTDPGEKEGPIHSAIMVQGDPKKMQGPIHSASWQPDSYYKTPLHTTFAEK